MANTYSAGIVTAYGAAKKAGYTGTYEEFCAEQASFAQNAQQVRQDKEFVEQTVETFSKTTVPAAVQSVTDEGTAQVKRVTNVGTTAVGNVNDAGTTQVGNVNNAGTTQVGNVNSAGTTQVGNVNEAGTNQVNAVNTAGATQVQAVEDKGAEVLETIPADYTELSNAVFNDVTGLDTKAPVILETASGAIASFDDGADNMPVKKLVAQIKPVQNLHGYENPWPAGGGKNKYNPDGLTNKQYNSAGTAYSNAKAVATDFIPVTAGMAYTISTNIEVYAYQIVEFDSGKAWIKNTNNTSLRYYTATLGSTTAYVKIVVNIDNVSSIPVETFVATYQPQFELGSTATAYAPYSNICPISGWTGAEIQQTGKNLFRAVNGTYAPQTSTTLLTCADGVFSLDNNSQYPLGVTALIPAPYMPNVLDNDTIIQPGTYSFSVDIVSLIGPTDILSKSLILTDVVNGVEFYISSGQTATLQNPAQIKEIKCALQGGYPVGSSIKFKVQLERSSAVTPYEPYTGNQISVTFPETIYGGEDEVISGKLKSTMGVVNLGEANWVDLTYQGVRYFYIVASDMAPRTTNVLMTCYAINSSPNAAPQDKRFSVGWSYLGGSTVCVRDDAYTDVSSFKAALEGQKMVYLLNQPIEYSTEAQTLDTLYGQNNIWSNTGDVTCTYPADTKLYIDGKLAELQATILENIGG